jgi:Tol biopolymer transport system component
MFLRSRINRLVALAALTGAAVLCMGVGSASSAWPGRNGPIIFASGEYGTENGLWSIEPNGKGMRHLTTDPTDSEVQTSADGRWIVFIRSVDVGGTSAQHVFIARADGRGVTEVTTGPVLDQSPSFSRSGRRIFFSRFVGASGEEKGFDVEHIFSVRRSGGGLRRLTSGHFSDRNPVSSPNGRIVAFERAGVVGVEPHVYTMRPNGSRVADATPNLAAWSSQPDFSPSGNRIVFVRGYPTAPNADLFTMRPNGKKWRRLTGRAHHPVGHFSSPSYSPDGRFVAAARMPGDRSPSKLEVIRVRDRSRVASLDGRQAPSTLSMQDPAWLAR